MKESIVKRLIKEVGSLKWYRSVEGVPGDGWFFYETTPLPPRDEIEQVIADIIYSREIIVDKGRLYHNYACQEKHIVKDNILRDVLKKLTAKKYQIALYPNLRNNILLKGQPIAFSINPEITLAKYPDHPHLNEGGYVHINNQEFYLPNSLCYTNRPYRLPGDVYKRLLYVFDEVTIWLLRHQVWEVLHNIKRNENWIGPSTEVVFEPKVYINNLNPLGKCRCGNSNSYMNCHMPYDIADTTNCTWEEAVRTTVFYYEYCKWVNNVLTPQNETLEKFRAYL